jgi:hypothetical protein
MTATKLHRSANGSKTGEFEEVIGRSQGGRMSKIHALADDRGRPVAIALTSGKLRHGRQSHSAFRLSRKS